MPPLLVYIGYLFVAGGLFIRWFSVYSLGNAFTVKVGIIQNQALITTGIYKKIRHPSYTGLLMYYFGLGIVMQNWICIVILSVIPMGVVFFRIKKEEAVLTSHFGTAYKTYMRQSYKLFPLIY